VGQVYRPDDVPGPGDAYGVAKMAVWKKGAALKPFSDPQGLHLRSQELPEAVQVAGNMYLIRCAVLEQYKMFFSPRTSGILCDQPYEAVDIDTEADWIAAEALARHYGRSP
jgi:CMP-N-acetylneuraminic acid synthetase